MDDFDFSGINYFHYGVSDKLTGEPYPSTTYIGRIRNSSSDYESYDSRLVSNEVVLSYIRSVLDDLDLWNFVQISYLGSTIQLSHCGETGKISIITINPFRTKDEVEKSIYTWILGW